MRVRKNTVYGLMNARPAEWNRIGRERSVVEASQNPYLEAGGSQ